MRPPLGPLTIRRLYEGRGISIGMLQGYQRLDIVDMDYCKDLASRGKLDKVDISSLQWVEYDDVPWKSDK